MYDEYDDYDVGLGAAAGVGAGLGDSMVDTALGAAAGGIYGSGGGDGDGGGFLGGLAGANTGATQAELDAFSNLLGAALGGLWGSSPSSDDGTALGAATGAVAGAGGAVTGGGLGGSSGGIAGISSGTGGSHGANHYNPFGGSEPLSSLTEEEEEEEESWESSAGDWNPFEAELALEEAFSGIYDARALDINEVYDQIYQKTLEDMARRGMAESSFATTGLLNVDKARAQELRQLGQELGGQEAFLNVDWMKALMGPWGMEQQFQFMEEHPELYKNGGGDRGGDILSSFFNAAASIAPYFIFK